MDQNKITVFTKYFLNIMFYSGILVVLSLPYTLQLVGKYYLPEFERYYWPMLIIYFLSGISGLIIVYQLRRMIRTVIEKNCFVKNNIISLKIMGKVSFLITFLQFIKVFFVTSSASFVIILTFFIAGIFSHVLGLVFEEAVRFKEENDLTI